MSEDFDATPYVRPPVLDVASGIALGIALINALPKGAPDEIRKSARKVRTAVVALQTAWEAAGGPDGPADKRPADNAIDNAWGALAGRLEDYASLPEKRWPKATRARELIGLVFPGGMAFLTLPYAAEWAESEKRLKRIEERKLAADLDALAGPEFLAEVRHTHADYGKALAITKPQKGATAVGLADPLRDLARAVKQHSLKLVSLAVEGGAYLEMARAGLRPIDEHRAAAAQRAASSDDAPSGGGEPPSPVTPTTPVPEVPS